MKHTKGPWKINIDTGEYGVYHLYSPDIGGDEVFEREEIDEANARLIAAAPELLEALDYIATQGSDCPPNIEPAEFYRDQLLACIGHAARAIAKAEANE